VTAPCGHYAWIITARNKWGLSHRRLNSTTMSRPKRIARRSDQSPGHHRGSLQSGGRGPVGRWRLRAPTHTCKLSGFDQWLQPQVDSESKRWEVRSLFSSHIDLRFSRSTALAVMQHPRLKWLAAQSEQRVQTVSILTPLDSPSRVGGAMARSSIGRR